MIDELWLDLADYSVVPTADQVVKLRSVGIIGAIVGTSYANPDSGLYVATDQLAAFESAGMPTKEYQFPGALKPTSREFYADAENSLATVESLRSALRSGSEGPYSRKGFADGLKWDCKAEFPESRLWDARYVHRDDFVCLIKNAVDTGGDIARAIQIEMLWITEFLPYWGFTEDSITQWHNSITLFGVNVDLNLVHYSTEQEEEGMKPYLAWDLIGAATLIGFPNGAAWITNANDLKTLEGIYGPMAIALDHTTVLSLGGKK